MPKSKSVQLALKQMRQAANNLSIAASDINATTVYEADMIRQASSLINGLSNAIENGAAYTIASRAQEFDKSNQVLRSSTEK